MSHSHKIWTDDANGISTKVGVTHDNLFSIGDATSRLKAIYVVSLVTSGIVNSGPERATAFNLADGADKNFTQVVYASGTAYTVTATSAAVTFGTTSPTFTFTNAGKYKLEARYNTELVGATFAANQQVNIKLRITSGTAADVPNSATNFGTGIVTTVNQSLDVGPLAVVFYQAAVGDVISMFANVAVVPTAGSLQITEACIVATRISA